MLSNRYMLSLIKDVHSGLATSAAQDMPAYEPSLVDNTSFLLRARLCRTTAPITTSTTQMQATTQARSAIVGNDVECMRTHIPAIRMVPVTLSPLELGDAVVVVSLLESDDDVAKQVYWPPCRFKHEKPRGHGKVEHAALL